MEKFCVQRDSWSPPFPLERSCQIVFSCRWLRRERRSINRQLALYRTHTPFLSLFHIRIYSPILEASSLAIKFLFTTTQLRQKRQGKNRKLFLIRLTKEILWFHPRGWTLVAIYTFHHHLTPLVLSHPLSFLIVWCLMCVRFLLLRFILSLRREWWLGTERCWMATRNRNRARCYLRFAFDPGPDISMGNRRNFSVTQWLVRTSKSVDTFWWLRKGNSQ